jgi:hypothetical protein
MLVRARLILAVLLVVAVAAAGAMAMFALHRAGEAAEPESAVGEVRGTESVVMVMRDLARLESAEFHMQRVIDLRDKQSRFFGLIEAEDAILLVAAADVVAGVDLSEMGDGDVTVDEVRKEVTVILPPPKVLGTRIVAEQTFVHARTTDMLAARNETLEARARKVAEDKLRDAAIEAGLLDRARRNAGETVRTLLGALGFRAVTVRWADHEVK